MEETDLLRDDTMRKLVKFITIIGICLVLIAAYVFYRQQTNDFGYTEGTPFDAPLASPNGEYSAQAFYRYYGGAAGGTMMFVNITDHRHEDAVRTIYYEQTHHTPTISWADNRTLAITNPSDYENYDAVLDVTTDVYDATGRACRAYKIKKKFHCVTESK